MEFSEEEINEFLEDVNELFDIAEKEFLKIEKNEGDIQDSYNPIFNSLHSLKGSLGMFGFTEQMRAIHKLEDFFKLQEEKKEIELAIVDMFLNSLYCIKDSLHDPDVNLSIDSFFHEDQMEPASEKVEVIEEPIEEEEQSVVTAINEISDEEDVVIYTQEHGEIEISKKTPVCDILVVDDDDFFRDALHEYFIDKNYKVITATNCEEGLNKVKENKNIQAIFCDFHMPKDNGTFLLNILNSLKLRIPVIMVSNEADREDLIEMIQSKPFSFVEKKDGFEAMHRVLKDALRERARELITEYYIEA